MAIPHYNSPHFDADVIRLVPGHETAVTIREINYVKSKLNVGDKIYTYRRPKFTIEAPIWEEKPMNETIISIHPHFIRTNKQCLQWVDVVMSLRRRLGKQWLEPRKISVRRY